MPIAVHDTPFGSLADTVFTARGAEPWSAAWRAGNKVKLVNGAIRTNS